MIPNALRIYKVENGIVVPDRLDCGTASKLCASVISGWSALLPELVGKARDCIDRSLTAPAVIKGGRWDARRASAMRKILLDRQSWETVDRRFDSVRFCERDKCSSAAPG